MVNASFIFDYSESAAGQRLCLLIAILVAIEDGQVIEDYRDRETIAPINVFPDGEGSLQQRLSVLGTVP